MLVSVTFITRKCSVSGEGRLPVTRCTFRIGARLPNSRQAAANRRLAAHSACAANELHAFAGEKGIHWRRSRRSASFRRFQGRRSVDMTLSGDTNPKFAILSFRPQCPAIAGFLFRAVARDYSFWVYIVTNRNSERCPHFGRHDRTTQHGNISHLVANEVEAFAGERGSLAVPRKPQLLNVSGQAVRYPILVDYAHSH